MLTFGSLFSGIGGIDLGLERAGMQCRWQSEIDPYASRVLAKHWPDIPNLGDVTKIDWRNVERTDVVAGGYPCQPFSVAGARKGEYDPRHLWPHFRNAICVLRPRYALLENVSGHLSLGFGHVLGDLAAIGYDARWDCIPAAAVGAPHLRDRVFVIATRQNMAHANPNSEPRRAIHGGKTENRSEQQRTLADSNDGRSRNSLRAGWDAPWHGGQNVANPASKRPQAATSSKQSAEHDKRSGVARGGPTWSPEPNVGRVADGIPRRMDRLRGLGNAVVPQVAEHVARIIIQDTQ